MALYSAVKVWDSTVRICHWLNAALVFILLFLGALRYMERVYGLNGAKGSLLVDLHAFTGFVFSAVLFVRILYLFSGGGTSGWRDIVPHRREQLELLRATLLFYLRGLKGAAPLYLGHNPLAGLAYMVFFVAGAFQALTGSAIYLFGGDAGAAYAGAAVASDTSWPPKWLLTAHLTGAVLTALFIAAHLSALAVHELVERRGLVSAMISGYKFFTREECKALGIERDEVRGEGG